MADGDPHVSEMAARQRVMGLCAGATMAELAAVLAALSPDGRSPEATDLRPAERGLVMLQGRMGGDGQPFNLGEASVTRAAVRLSDGRTGHAYQLGRDTGKARAAAVLDALVQGPERAAVEAALAPVRSRLDAAAGLSARRTAATQVDFFTMVRGED